jgi:hypothetical protein
MAKRVTALRRAITLIAIRGLPKEANRDDYQSADEEQSENGTDDLKHRGPIVAVFARRGRGPKSTSY